MINEGKDFKLLILLTILVKSERRAMTECYQSGKSHETKQNKNSILFRTKRKNARVYGVL